MMQYVFYDDTDCGGIVYHTNYIKFCERARSLLFFERNLLPQKENCGFVVRNMESDFIASLQFGDKYHVKTSLIAMKNTAITLKQEVIKLGSVGENNTETQTLAFALKVQLVYVDIAAKKPCKIPEEFKEILQTMAFA